MKISTGVEWQLYFGKNHNYTSAILLLLSPFVLIRAHHTNREYLSTLIIIIALPVIFFFTSTRGVLICYLFGLCFYIYFLLGGFKYLASNFLKVSILFICLLAVMILILFASPISQDFIHGSTEGRKYMTIASLQLLWDSCLLGVGLDNWYLYAYKYNLNEFQEVGHHQSFIRRLNHNQILNIAAELGLAGISLFLSLFIIAIYKAKRSWSELTAYHKACAYSITCYLLLSFFYYTTNSHTYFFSGIQCIAFISLGSLLTKNISS